jgi:uncharacterized protein (TIGR02996 family)
VTPAREPNLEALIRADRDNGAAYDVYSDWLQSHGNLVGDLIAVQRALDAADSAELRLREAELVAALDAPRDSGVAQGDVEPTWRWGLWDTLRIRSIVGGTSRDAEIDTEAAARFAFAHTACVALRELQIDIADWRYRTLDPPLLLELAAEQAWAGALRVLGLGVPFKSPWRDSVAGMSIGDTCGQIRATFPRLTELSLCGDFSLDELAFDELATLVIATTELTPANVAELYAAQLPALTDLELWIGWSRDATITLADLAPLLAGQVFPRLAKLGVCNADFADDLAHIIHHAPIAAQLTRLDLSKGTLTQAGAIALAGNAACFPRLRTLDVSASYLDDNTVAALRRSFGHVDVIAGDQRTSQYGSVWVKYD